MMGITTLPGRQQRTRIDKVDQLYLCVIGEVVNGVWCAKCTCLSHRVCEGERDAKQKAGESKRHGV